MNRPALNPGRLSAISCGTDDDCCASDVDASFSTCANPYLVTVVPDHAAGAVLADIGEQSSFIVATICEPANAG